MFQIETDTPQKFAESFERHLAGVTEVADLAQMESWLDDELQCESSHGPDGHGANDSGCTVTVTHRLVRDCGVAQLVCESRAAYFKKMNPVWKANGAECFYCWSSSCFTQIIPI